MDLFLKELVLTLDAWQEDVVLVLYGDHLPNIAKDANIELSISNYQTEYIVVTNYDIEDKELSIIGNDIQAYLLFPGIMELIGNNTGTINKYHRQFINTDKYQENLEKLAYDGLHGEKYAYDDEARTFLFCCLGGVMCHIGAEEDYTQNPHLLPASYFRFFGNGAVDEMIRYYNIEIARKEIRPWNIVM